MSLSAISLGERRVAKNMQGESAAVACPLVVVSVMTPWWWPTGGESQHVTRQSRYSA